MLRPRWIAVLLLALVVSRRLRLARAVAAGARRRVERDRRRADRDASVALVDVVATPGDPLRDSVVGQLVDGRPARCVAGDYLVIDRAREPRRHRLLGGRPPRHRTGASDPAVAVALGWAADRETADEAAAALNADTEASVVTVAGRLNCRREAPEVPDDGEDPYDLTTMSVAALINIWPAGDAPSTTATSWRRAPDGLVTIDRPRRRSRDDRQLAEHLLRGRVGRSSPASRSSSGTGS